MFAKRKFTFLTPLGAARFLVGAAVLMALAAPALAQFQNGDFCTYTQGGWGSVPQGNNPGTILRDSTIFTFPVSVGTGYSMTFKTADAITAYLPAGSKPKPLTMNYENPPTTSSGVFGGQVLALQLNVTLDPAGFGGLVIINTGTFFDGMTVGDVLEAANLALGGGALPSGYTIPKLNDLVSFLNQDFDNCLPSGWAQQFLTPVSGGGDPPPPPF